MRWFTSRSRHDRQAAGGDDAFSAGPAEPVRADTPKPGMRPDWAGLRGRASGRPARLPQVDEFFGTSTQVCGGFWPFSTDMELPVDGVPVGRSLTSGSAVCCDPISWFKAGIIEQPSMFVMGLPAIGKSTFVRRQVWGLAALGMNAIIPGDLKPDYAREVRLLGGQVICLGSGVGSINPLDPGDMHAALRRLSGRACDDLTADWHERRKTVLEVILTVARTGRASGSQTVTDVESNILATGLQVLHEHTADAAVPPVIADLRDLISQGPDPVRAAAVFDAPDDDDAYREATRDLLASLHGIANPRGRFGRLFCEQTTEHIDLSRPVDYDISALAQSGDAVVAATLAATWTSAFAAKAAADALADAGLEPARNHVIIMDEMHRALRASPMMVDSLDLLTRLNRQWGVGQIMITHTFADLMCLDSPAANAKARGFVERSKIKVLGALSRAEVSRFLRAESGLPLSVREEDLLDDWATPTNFAAHASLKGLGRFLIKLGGLPGIPVGLELCDLELGGFNDTNTKWHH